MSRLPTQPSLCDSSQILRGGGREGDSGGTLSDLGNCRILTKYEYQALAWELSGLEKYECGIVKYDAGRIGYFL